ncbi:hypothetical protein OG381_39200 [Streptomyces sp. NBC_00490]|uniref:hypothetical protein n=1 Tax=Streptomyces sp. NBC_00490 TaxID=2903657 RepID=UPI002E19DB99
MPETDAALELAGDRERWHQGREVLALIRGREPQAGSVWSGNRCAASPSCAKVAHNAAGPPPYFEHEAGWQIGPVARPVAATAQDPDRIEVSRGPAD